MDIKSVLVACVELFATMAFAGGMTSSGGDTHKWGDESAWFLGTTPISYCVDIGPGQKITEAQVLADFRSVVETWKAYYLEREPSLHPAEHKLNFNFVLERCQPTTRLKIYVGVDNDETRKAKALFENPFAFAYRSGYDLTSGMGQGFIWFAADPHRDFAIPDWSTPYVFHGALLHEMGHVYGCGHKDHTIMEANLVGDLQTAASRDANWARYGKMYMTHIDHHHLLIYNSTVRLSMKGVLSLNAGEAAARFLRLTGRVPKGTVSAEITLDASQVVLKIADDVGEERFEIPLNWENRTSFSSENQVFFAVRGAVGFATGTSGTVFLTSFETKKGERLVAQVAINSNEWGWPISLSFMDRGLMTSLFGSDLWLNEGLPR